MTYDLHKEICDDFGPENTESNGIRRDSGGMMTSTELVTSLLPNCVTKQLPVHVILLKIDSKKKEKIYLHYK